MSKHSVEYGKLDKGVIGFVNQFPPGLLNYLARSTDHFVSWLNVGQGQVSVFLAPSVVLQVRS